MKMLKILVLFDLLLSLQQTWVNAFPTLYVKPGEDAYFSWKFELREEIEKIESVWILNQKRENVFWFSRRGIGITNPYTHRIIFNGNFNNGTVRFTLLNVTADDAGIYFSQYTNSQTEGQELVLFDIPGKPVIEEILLPVLDGVLILNCTTKSNSISLKTNLEMQYRWTMDNEQISNEERYNMSGPQLSVSPLHLDDTGSIFTCFAFESCCNVTSKESQIYTVQVQYGPRLLNIHPEYTTYYIEEGQEFGKVTGTAMCNPDCTTYWSKENNTGVKIKGSTLKLGKISPEDSGAYLFHAVNSIDQTTTSLKIIVTDSPPAPYLVPSKSAVEGEDLILYCQDVSQREGKTKLMFFIAEFNWKTSRMNSRQSERYIIKDSEFTLREVNRDDDGTIVSCAFSTKNGKTSVPSDKFVMHVKYGPNEVLLSKSKHLRAREGKRLDNLTCKAECNPTCFFQWYKGENQHISLGNILSLGNINVEKSGDYFCRAFNDYGNKTSEKIHIDVLVITLKDSFTCIEHDNIHIICSLDETGHSMKFLPWVHLNSNVTIRYINGQNNGLISDLTIKDCSFYDIGKYKCRVYSIGDTTGKLETAKTSLSVLGPPHFIDAITFILKTRASIIARFFSNPAIQSSAWYRGTVKLTNNSKYRSSIDLKLSKERVYTKYAHVKVFEVILDISGLESADFGNYTVVVWNEFGEKIEYVILPQPNDSNTWSVPVYASVTSGLFLIFVIALVVGIRIRLMKKRRAQEFRVALQMVKLRMVERERDQGERHNSRENLSEIQEETAFYDDISEIEEESNDCTPRIENPEIATVPRDEDNHSSTSYDDVIAIVSNSDVSIVSSVEEINSSYDDLRTAIKPTSYIEIGDTGEITANKSKEVPDLYEVESNLADDERSSISDT